MKNPKDISRIVENVTEKMKEFAAIVPPDAESMTYLYKAHDIMSSYEKFLNAETEEEIELIQQHILAEIELY